MAYNSMIRENNEYRAPHRIAAPRNAAPRNATQRNAMNRHEFTTKIKLAAWERSNGRCEQCTAELATGNIAYDHIHPIALGGKSVLANCAVLCRACHGSKTSKRDIRAIAKTRRIRNHHIGISQQKRRAFMTNRNGPFKKTLPSVGKPYGEIVRR